jgi:hypothetical protein
LTLGAALQGGALQLEAALARVRARALAADGSTRQLGTLSYVVDQLGTVGRIVQAVIELRTRGCVYGHGDGGGGGGGAVTAAALPECVKNSTAPAALVTLGDVLGAVARAAGDARRYFGEVNGTLLSLRGIVPHGEAELRAYLQGMAGPLQRANASALLLTRFMVAAAEGSALLAAVSATQAPLSAAVNGNLDVAGNATRSARHALGAVRDEAGSSARRLIGTVEPAVAAVLLYGVAVAAGALLYALSMQHLVCPLLDLDRLSERKCVQQLCFGVLYAALDVFVVLSFLWMLAVTMLATLQGLFVSACWGVGVGVGVGGGGGSADDAAAAALAPAPAAQLPDIRGAVCRRVDGDLVAAIGLAVGGGTANFLLSYHLMALLQASYSKYVSGRAGKVTAEGRRIDFNGDGQAHSLGFDTVGDGKVDTVLRRAAQQQQQGGAKIVV